MNGTTPDAHDHRELLKQIARQAMVDYGLWPDFSREALDEATRAHARSSAGPSPVAAGRDLRHLLWCSIDNDDSRDLDQLSVSEPQAGGAVRILVAIADVDALVEAGGAIDAHARQNTTSVYTPAAIFPMLPERLSTDLTSLAFGEERHALVVDLVIDSRGDVGGRRVPRAGGESREARLQQRRGLARGRVSDAGGDGRRSRAGRGDPQAGRGGAAAAAVAPRARRARLPDHRGAADLRREHRAAPSPRSGTTARAT